MPSQHSSIGIILPSLTLWGSSMYDRSQSQGPPMLVTYHEAKVIFLLVFVWPKGVYIPACTLIGCVWIPACTWAKTEVCIPPCTWTGCVWQGLGGQGCRWGCTPPVMETEAVGVHPTIMHSCSQDMLMTTAQLPCCLSRNQQVAHQRWIWGFCCVMSRQWILQTRGSTLALKTNADITGSKKTGISVDPQKGLMSSKNLKKSFLGDKLSTCLKLKWPKLISQLVC